MPELVAPAYRSTPPWAYTNGAMAAEVGRQVGLVPDLEQQLVLDAMYAENTPGAPACFEVAVVAPRQNLKTAVLQVAALTDLFVMDDELIVWTAHLFTTARKAFDGMVALIEGNDDFRRRCRKPRTANGDEAIELLTGHKIEFHARSKGGGRGLTGSKVVLDEALFLGATELGALLPTLATRPEAQVRYGSSAAVSSSEALRDVSRRGRAGGDPALGYFEWAAPQTPCQLDDCVHTLDTPGCALDRVDLWRLANPALGRRISEQMVARFRRSMPPVEFAREFLGWEDALGVAAKAFSASLWASLSDPGAPRGAPCFAVDVAPDLSSAAIAAAWARPDGATQVMLADHQQGTSWVPQRCEDLTSRWGGRLTLLSHGTAAFLLGDLERLGVPVDVQPRQFFPEAAATWTQALTALALHHGNQPELNEAVAAASWLTSSEGAARVWSRKRPVVVPLNAAALAVQAVAALNRRPPPMPLMIKVSDMEESVRPFSIRGAGF